MDPLETLTFCGSDSHKSNDEYCCYAFRGSYNYGTDGIGATHDGEKAENCDLDPARLGLDCFRKRDPRKEFAGSIDESS